MNAIVGFTSLLKDEDIEPHEKIEFIDIISNNCDILMVLINDILEISLIEADQLQLARNPFNVFRVLEELESYYKMNNPKKLHIEFQRGSTDNAIIVNDQTRFRQVMSNLLNNAYKYTEKGSIHFGFEMIKNEIRFFVKDTGIGIAESEYQKIFDYFHKIDKGDNKLYRGAGIGLSISNKLVELMGGKIWLASEIGKGSNFYFTLPSYTDSNTEERIDDQKAGRKQPVRNLSGNTILVAEDEANNYVLIEKILRPTKAIIVWVKNGKEAVDFVAQNHKNKDLLIIMDIKMPVMNGIHASDEIGKINSSIPVIAVTAYAQAKNKEEIMRHNFRDYIAKPFQPDILLRKIYQCID